MNTTPTPALPLHIGEIVGRRLISEDASEFWGYFEGGYQGTKKEYVYTADQMREYARAAIISDRATRVPSDAEIERAAFEAAYIERHGMRLEDYDFTRRLTGHYQDEDVQTGWDFWQARALLAGAGSSGGSDSPKSKPCAGKNCGSTTDWLHSAECFAEHEACVSRGSSGGSDSQTLIDAYALGWHACSGWAQRDDLLADIGSPAYIADREKMLAKHDSDCALFNEPAYPAGPCDCRLSTSTAGAEQPKPGIVVRFQPVSAGLPKLAHYSTSYGGQWTSERCVVIDGFGDVGTSRLSVSASVKEAIDAGRNPPIVWRDGVGSPTVAAWAYAIAIKATLASPPLPSPVAEVKPTAPESVDWTPDEAEKVQRFFDGKPQARPPEEKS